MRSLCSLLGVVLLLLLPVRVPALEPGKAFHHYVQQGWSIEHGLPQITVLAIAQDRRGYLWVGTQSGLARFDGVRFTIYNPTSEPELPGIWIRGLHVARDGTLWIATSRGVARHDGRRFRTVPASDPARWPNLDANGFTEDADGGMWVATMAGLFRSEGGALHPVTGTPVPATTALARKDGLWVGGLGAAHRFRNGRWAHLPLPAEAANASVTRLREAQGRLWATTTQGLFVLDAGGWQPLADAPQLSGVPLELLQADSDGNLWVGGDAGLARIRGGVLAEFVPTGGPGAIAGPRSALEDHEGNLWIGSQWTGLHRLGDSWTRRFSQAEGLQEPIVWSVSPDPDGRRTWVGSNDGVSVFDGKRFTVVVHGKDLPHPHGYNLLAERERLWIGTRRGVAVIDHAGPQAGRVRLPAVLAPLRSAQIQGFVRTPDGTLWIPSSAGLFRLDGERLRQYGQEAGLPDLQLRFFLRTREGRLLVGTASGVFELRGERFVPVGREAGLSAADVTALHQLRDGRLLVGTLQEQIHFLDGGRWHPLGPEQGMPANAPFFFAEHGGYLWAAGIRGITRVPVADLSALASGQRKRVRGEMLLNERGDPRSGQQGYCCNGAGTAKGFLRGQTLWLPTRDGVVAMDIPDIRKNPVPPPVAIERVQVRDAWRDAWTLRDEALPADARDLGFEFTVLSLADPESIVAEYRLQGYDKGWNAADPLHRTTRYTNLPPGRYVFEVRGRNNAGVASTQPARLPFRIRPRLHETAWFLLLPAAALVLLGYAGHRFERRLHRKKQQELEGLVQQRTRALEDAYDQLAEANSRLAEASLTDPLTGLRNRRYLGTQIPVDLAFYDRQLRQGVVGDEVMLFVMIDIDHFKSINDRLGHKAGDMVLQQFAQCLTKLVRTGDYVARWGGEEFLLVFRPMPLRNLEIIANRLRASVAEKHFDVGNGATLHVTCSIGLSQYPLIRSPDAVLNWESMVELADQALYYVKTHGRNGWAAFRATERTDTTTLLSDLQRLGPQRMVDEGRLEVIGKIVGEG